MPRRNVELNVDVGDDEIIYVVAILTATSGISFARTISGAERDAIIDAGLLGDRSVLVRYGKVRP